MFDVIGFIASLMPTATRDNLVDTLRALADELKKETIPPYKNSLDVFKKWEPKNKNLIIFTSTFHSINKTNKNESMINIILDGLQKLHDMIDPLITAVQESFDKEIVMEGIGYRKASIIRLVELFVFTAQYARVLLNYIYIEQTKLIQTNNESLKTDFKMIPKEVSFVENNFTSFAQMIHLIRGKNINKNNLDTVIRGIPDITANAQSLKIASINNSSTDLDPIGLGLVTVNWNPIFAIRVKWEEYKHSRYLKAIKEKECLSLRLMHYKLQLDGKENAAIEARIEFLQEEVDDLTRKIYELEGNN